VREKGKKVNKRDTVINLICIGCLNKNKRNGGGSWQILNASKKEAREKE